MHGRRTLFEIADKLGISYPTLQEYFDQLDWSEGLVSPVCGDAVNLIIDTTFFGRQYGYFCFHDTQRIIWFCEVKTENVAILRRGLYELWEAGYRFKSITIDGKKGFIQAIRKALGGVPIQMCHFHQKMIVRRYLTNNPKTECGRDLKALMNSLGSMKPEEFINAFYLLKEQHRSTLEKLNEKKQYQHKKLRSAFRSVQENMHMLFTYTDLTEQNIPNTTNHLEGCFAHLKERIKIHRGLKMHRKKKAIRFFMNSF